MELLVKTNAKQQAEQVLALIPDRQPIDLQAVTQAQCEAVLGRPERALPERLIMTSPPARPTGSEMALAISAANSGTLLRTRTMPMTACSTRG